MLEPLGVPKEKIENMASFLKDRGHEFYMYEDRVEDNRSLIERSQNAEVVILSNIPYRAEVIHACPKLKMISVAFTGVDHIDVNACKEKGITVCNAAGYSTDSVAELAFGLIVAVMRNIVKCDELVRNGKTKAGYIGNDISGKTLGIIGTGAIGLRVAEIGKAFGCKLLAYSRTEKENPFGIKYVDLKTLLAESDIVSLHVPLNDKTKNLIDKEAISLMKPNSILINTARGPVVDSQALAAALKEGKIAGAGIDVFEMEPPVPANHPLLSAPSVVAAPHVAFATWEAFYRRAQIVLTNVKAWLDGEPQNRIV
jgi:D-3-phosphoglycerate dehydrogenase